MITEVGVNRSALNIPLRWCLFLLLSATGLAARRSVAQPQAERRRSRDPLAQSGEPRARRQPFSVCIGNGCRGCRSWLPNGCHAVACGFIAVAAWLSISSKWTVAARLPTLWQPSGNRDNRGRRLATVVNRCRAKAQRDCLFRRPPGAFRFLPAILPLRPK